MNGNVYAGCGDGVQVWNPSGKLIGKIFLGETSANFQVRAGIPISNIISNANPSLREPAVW
jgi:hypothetical protein